jgi:hypothetical protein
MPTPAPPRFEHFDWRNVSQTERPMSPSARDPTRTSLSQCRPRTTREAATLTARRSTGTARRGKARAITEPMAKALRA